MSANSTRPSCASSASILVMAGGTGGHVFPALAVARQLMRQGARVVWLGTPGSFESRLIPTTGIPFQEVPVKGLRGKGWMGWFKAPFALHAHSCWRCAPSSGYRLTWFWAWEVTQPGPVGWRQDCWENRS